MDGDSWTNKPRRTLREPPVGRFRSADFRPRSGPLACNAAVFTDPGLNCCVVGNTQMRSSPAPFGSICGFAVYHQLRLAVRSKRGRRSGTAAEGSPANVAAGIRWIASRSANPRSMRPVMQIRPSVLLSLGLSSHVEAASKTATCKNAEFSGACRVTDQAKP
jgi:hypothetical protein